MAEDGTNLVLEHLRPIRLSLDRVVGDLGDLKLRMSSVEVHLGQMQVQMAGQNSRMDRFEERMTRIEHRSIWSRWNEINDGQVLSGDGTRRCLT